MAQDEPRTANEGLKRTLDEALAIAADLANPDAGKRGSAALRVGIRHVIVLAGEVQRLQEAIEDIRLENMAASTYRESQQCSE